MTEFSVPAKFTIAADANCTDVIFDIAAQDPNKTLFRDKVDGHWAPITAAEAAATITALAKGFIAQGIKPGDRIALLSRTRLEWVLIDVAIWSAGAIPVPIYDSSSGPQIDWILEDSQAVAIVVEDDGQRAIVEEIGNLSSVKTVYQIENGDDGIVATLTAAGADVADSEVAARRDGVKSADPATLIYTSGTTGRPKGCMLTHANMLSEIDAVLEGNMSTLLGPSKRLLMFLPLAHVLARAITYVALKAGVEVGFTADTRNLLPEFAAFRPSLILSVPRVFEKVYNTARQNAHSDGKGKIFDLAADTAVAYSQSLDAGGAGLGLRLRHTVFDKL
ncbi:long-chain fatty-acid--CoA ligase FadD, partial [Gordonia effusa NBRC 100432]